MPNETQQPQEHTFESALARLESIVGDMEGDQLPLEQLIVAFEEGTKLARICQDKLSEAEKKIEIIQRRSPGEEPQLKSFDASQSAAAKPAAKDVSLF